MPRKNMIKNPWVKTRSSIQSRCNCKTHKSYKDYGGRGIKCLITSQELRILWCQANACTMKKPSIDRIDSNKDYTFSNCRYIEFTENSGREKRKPIIDGKKECADCKEMKPIEMFYKSEKYNQSYCKPCSSIRRKRTR